MNDGQHMRMTKLIGQTRIATKSIEYLSRQLWNQQNIIANGNEVKQEVFDNYRSELLRETRKLITAAYGIQALANGGQDG